MKILAPSGASVFIQLERSFPLYLLHFSGFVLFVQISHQYSASKIFILPTILFSVLYNLPKEPSKT